MLKNDPALLEYKFFNNEFDAAFFISEVKKDLPELEEPRGWIRSGLRIASDFRNEFSSYKLIGEYKPSDGGAKVEVILVKPRPGANLEDVAGLCVDLIKWHMSENGVHAVYTALAPGAGEGWYSMLISSGAKNDMMIPDDMIDFICTGAVKQYIARKCGISEAALDGYFAESYVLFDDSVINTKAETIDAALASVKACDISCGSGQLLSALADKIASVRFGLNRYIGVGPNRTKEHFLAHCAASCLYATDLDSGALELFKLKVKSLAGPESEIPVGRFVPGNILTEELFGETLFDIVITNPPHMRQEEFAQIKKKFENYEVYHDGADLYCYFAERTFTYAAEGGAVALLMSNRWMRSAYGAPLRTFLSSRNVTDIVDYGNIPILKTTVTPMSIIIGTNDDAKGKAKVTEVDERDYESLSLYCDEEAQRRDLRHMGAAPWSFDSKDEAEIMEKIAAAGIPLEDYCNAKIRRGILTGLNDAFILEEERARNIIDRDPGSAEILRPFLSGRHVKRYTPPKAERYLIFTPKGFTDEERGTQAPWEWFSTAYPAVAEHLLPFKERAEARSDKGSYWWELRACQYYGAFESIKIISPSIVKRISATMDTGGTFSNDKTMIIETEDYYLLGVLNSTLMDFYVRRTAPKLLNNHFELRRTVLSKLPIREISETNSFRKRLRDKIAESAKALLELNRTPADERSDEAKDMIIGHEREINGAVYKLYRMTPGEIKIIDNY